MEKMKHRPSQISESLYITSKQGKQRGGDDKEDELFSIGSCFSLYSSGASKEAFVSANTDFSRRSSLNKIDFPEIWRLDLQDSRRRSIIYELCDCEGWPFGLCKKTVLLPPLPKSPSESWSWLNLLMSKGNGLSLAKTPLV
ncbi:hypothetical protein F3Y22_tig00111210pilonHSYRG00375 [Hibiscus syriacus]|uniref:Uncharacterized protein n=1 Tax=Hibiscus syriacus TaxID=106335 RepID=A0A6A2YVD1_HIBSY|nr:hypothetical protein F3Y22_tig00111210pilonHSYRG00375 [Hibiscus syriacus]